MNIPRPQYNLFKEHKMRIKYFSTTSYTKTVCVDVWSPSHTLWGDNSCGGLFLLHVIQGVYWCYKYLIILLHSKILQHWLWLKQCGSRFKVIKREQNTACEQHFPTMQFWPQFSKILCQILTLQLMEHGWDFQINALWDTLQYDLLSFTGGFATDNTFHDAIEIYILTNGMTLFWEALLQHKDLQTSKQSCTCFLIEIHRAP